MKKKILLLSDDLRMHSGISTMSRELVLGTAHKYNWVQIAGSINHPDKGKVFDLSLATNEKLKINDSFVKLYATDGYGNPDILRQILSIEHPDVILHFTDPRFWGWLYQMEREIRSVIPLTYLNIWDDLPYPIYNRAFYESCDLLMAISKQTENINKCVLKKNNYTTLNTISKNNFKTLITYVPHGINKDEFFPITEDNQEDYAKMIFRKKELFRDKKYEFVLYYNNRNIRRKQTSDVVLAYKHFVDNLPQDYRKSVVLLMHTQPKDDNGTDLFAVKDAICPDYDIIFSSGRISPDIMNCQYNIADVTINIGSNEGFGLSGAESIMCGTPIINTVTGGLQDQLGFVDENNNPIEFNENWSSNHDGRYKKHGIWGIPIYPTSRSVQGSIPTPYIFDDRVRLEDVSTAIMAWYKIGRSERKRCGLVGRNWAINEGGLNSKNMCDRFIESIECTLQNWSPRKSFDFIKFENIDYKSGGISLEKIKDEDVEKLIGDMK